MWKKLLGVGLGFLAAAGSASSQWDGVSTIRIPVMATPLPSGPGQVVVPGGAPLAAPVVQPLTGGHTLKFLVIPAGTEENASSYVTKHPGDYLTDPRGNSGGWPCERVYADFEFLYWATQGVHIVPLVTTGPSLAPPYVAGALGQPSTEVLFGGQRMLNSFRPGYRIEVGTWLDPEQSVGVSSRAFDLGVTGPGLAGGSNGSQLLSLPMIIPYEGAQFQTTVPVGYPGLTHGTFDVNTSTNFLGTDLNLRRVVARGPDARMELYGGYRYLHLGDTLNSSFDAASTSPTGPRLMGYDSLRTRNNFNGGQTGFLYTRTYGPMSLSVESSIGLGATTSYLDAGQTRALGTVDGPLVPVRQSSTTNVRNDFAMVSELGTKLGLNLSSNLRLTAGYNILYWSKVRRAQEQYELIPAVPNRTTDFWAQGGTVGMELRY